MSRSLISFASAFAYFTFFAFTAARGKHRNAIANVTANATIASAAVTGSDFSHVTVCAGVQKAGTKSLKEVFKRLSENFVNGEMHFFDKNCVPPNVGNKPLFESLESALAHAREHCPVDAYLAAIHERARGDRFSRRKHGVFVEKTPNMIMHPHVTHILAHEVIPRHGKVFVLLRDPTKRFVSGYFQMRPKWRSRSIDSVVAASFDQTDGKFDFRHELKWLYDMYERNRNVRAASAADTASAVAKRGWILSELKDAYVRQFYAHVNGFGANAQWTWMRGSYAAQVLPLLRFVSEHQGGRFRHSFKIVQSEQLFGGQSYQTTMTQLRCWIHFDPTPTATHKGGDGADSDRAHSEWMSACAKKGKYQRHYPQAHSNSRAAGHVVTDRLLQRTANSYESSNKWLHVLLDELYPQAVLGEWDWRLWKFEGHQYRESNETSTK